MSRPPYQVILHSAPAAEITKALLDTAARSLHVAESLQVEKDLVADVVAYLAGAGLVVAAED